MARKKLNKLIKLANGDVLCDNVYVEISPHEYNKWLSGKRLPPKLLIPDRFLESILVVQGNWIIPKGKSYAHPLVHLESEYCIFFQQESLILGYIDKIDAISLLVPSEFSNVPKELQFFLVEPKYKPTSVSCGWSWVGLSMYLAEKYFLAK